MRLAWQRLDDHDVDHELIWAWIVLLGAIGGGFWLSRFGLPPVICMFHAVTGFPCLTCGATRAALLLVEGNPAGSLRMHPAVPVGLLMASIYVPYALTVSTARLPRIRLTLTPEDWVCIRWAAALTVALLWIYLIADGR